MSRPWLAGAVTAALATAMVTGCSPGDARRDAVRDAERSARAGVDVLRGNLAAELARRETAEAALAAVRPLLQPPRQRPATRFLLHEEVAGDEARLTVAVFGAGRASPLGSSETVWAEMCAELRGSPAPAPVVTVRQVRCPAQRPPEAPVDVESVLEPSA